VALARSDVTHVLEATRAGGDIDVIRERGGWSSCSRPSSTPKQQRSSELAATSEASGARHSATVTGTVCSHQGWRWRACASAKLRQGSFFPSILERRRRVDRALCTVVMEVYV